ncbi:lysophospholipid acyltransferase family protein [Hutsoniella sourekii]
MINYSILVSIIKWVLLIFNGKSKIYGLDHLPKDQPVIFAATHQSNTDPFFLAAAIQPKVVAFMAKEELFRFKPLAWLLNKGHVFPVNRQNPSTKSIRHAATVLKQGDKNLGIFPTGSRHSDEIKPGTAFIQKLSKATIIPVAIQPPIGFIQFIMRKQAYLAFGQPIAYDSSTKYDKDKLVEIDQNIQKQWNQLNQLIDGKK